MAGEEVRRIRQELGQSFSEGQVDLLRAIRSELSSQRWQVMLEIDAAQEDLQAALRACSDATVRPALEAVQARLTLAHQQFGSYPRTLSRHSRRQRNLAPCAGFHPA